VPALQIEFHSDNGLPSYKKSIVYHCVQHFSEIQKGDPYINESITSESFLILFTAFTVIVHFIDNNSNLCMLC